jgi:hypothetical protein
MIRICGTILVNSGLRKQTGSNVLFLFFSSQNRFRLMWVNVDRRLATMNERVLWLGYGLDRTIGVRFPAGAGIHLSATLSKPGLEPTQRLPWALLPGVKQLGHVVKRSPPPRART